MPDSRVTGGLRMSEYPILQVAVVGSGPSGFYAAAALAGSQTPCRIDIFERLPSPYGLIRAGVAPDRRARAGDPRAHRAEVFGQPRLVGRVEGCPRRHAGTLPERVTIRRGRGRDRTLGER